MGMRKYCVKIRKGVRRPSGDAIHIVYTALVPSQHRSILVVCVLNAIVIDISKAVSYLFTLYCTPERNPSRFLSGYTIPVSKDLQAFVSVRI